MSKSIFAARHFNDETAAFAYVEALVWADGRVCPHCGVFERVKLGASCRFETCYSASNLCHDISCAAENSSGGSGYSRQARKLFDGILIKH